MTCEAAPETALTPGARLLASPHRSDVRKPGERLPQCTGGNVRLKLFGATLAAVVAVGSLTTAAASAPQREPHGASHKWQESNDPSIKDGSPLDECIDAAQDVAEGADIESWSCIGGELVTTTVDTQGKLQRQSRDVVPRVVEWQDPDTITPADDYDSWCESGSICGRSISAYIAEVKGNGAYGDGNGVIGSFDQVLRASMSGSRPGWRALLDWDSGPAITPQEFTISCKKHVASGPDPVCGSTKTWYAGVISSSKTRTWYPNSTTYSFLDVNLGGSTTKYHDDYRGTFFAAGKKPLFSTGTLHTGRWSNCSNTCTYYQVPWTSTP